MTKHKKPFLFEGDPLTDERADQITREVYSKLDAMTDEEIAAHTVTPGALAKRMGRPRVDGDAGTGPSAQVRVRVSGDLLGKLDARSTSSHRTRSEVIREALEAHLKAG